MELDDPRYLISEVALAGMVPANTIRSWFQRKHLRLIETDQRADVNGMAHRLSLRSALRIGAMGALVAQGVDPARAGQAALRWTDHGDAKRDPAALYNDPMTLLCAYADGTAAVKHSPIKTGRALDLLIAPSGRAEGVAFIVLDTVDRRIRTSLRASAEG